MIKNIVFDMGGVLICWNPEDMLTLYDIGENEKVLLSTELFRSVEWIQLDRGVLEQEQAIQTVCTRLPENLHETVRLIITGWFRRYLRPMPGMADLVRELKENGYGIYLLSNASLTLREYFDRIPGAESFDALMVSAEEKVLKPQHEIYERLFEKFALKPEESWFIDDAPANAEGAILCGMGATIFRGDVARLRRELRAAGINCSQE